MDPRPMPTRQRRAALAALLALLFLAGTQQVATADEGPDRTVELLAPSTSSAEEPSSRVTTSGGVTCWNDYVTTGGYVEYEDPELDAYVSLRLTHYYRTCDSPTTPRVRSFRATRFSFAGRSGRDLLCDTTGFDRIQVNIGALAGYNPPLWDTPCKAGGGTVLYDPADIRITAASDRGAGAEVKIILNNWPDVIVHFPVVTIPAP